MANAAQCGNPLRLQPIEHYQNFEIVYLIWVWIWRRTMQQFLKWKWANINHRFGWSLKLESVWRVEAPTTVRWKSRDSELKRKRFKEPELSWKEKRKKSAEILSQACTSLRCIERIEEVLRKVKLIPI